jgi:hypothetical protein
MTDTIVNRRGQTLDFAEAERVARRVNAENKECWWNAARGLRNVYRRRPGVRYVEGHAIGHYGIVAEHGWLELPTGVIVDPTPSWHGDDGGTREAATAPVYFGAMYYTIDDLRARGHREPKQMPYVHAGDTWSGWRVLRYQRAYLHAMAFAFNTTPAKAGEFMHLSPALLDTLLQEDGSTP